MLNVATLRLYHVGGSETKSSLGEIASNDILG